MAQFDVFVSNSSSGIYFCQIQASYHDHLDSRVVVPLYEYKKYKREFQSELTPRVMIGEKEYLVMIAEMASMPKHHLGKKVGSMDEYYFEINRAADFLMQGF